MVSSFITNPEKEGDKKMPDYKIRVIQYHEHERTFYVKAKNKTEARKKFKEDDWDDSCVRSVRLLPPVRLCGWDDGSDGWTGIIRTVIKKVELYNKRR